MYSTAKVMDIQKPSEMQRMKALSARNSPILAKIGGPLKLLSLSDKLPDPPRLSSFTILSLLFRTTFFSSNSTISSLYNHLLTIESIGPME